MRPKGRAATGNDGVAQTANKCVDEAMPRSSSPTVASVRNADLRAANMARLPVAAPRTATAGEEARVRGILPSQTITRPDAMPDVIRSAAPNAGIR